MSEKRARSKRKAAVAAVPVASSPAEQIRDAVRKILPAAFREGEVQAERVLQVLGAEQNPDRYRFEWAGKNKALHLAAAPPAGTLAPDTRRSRDFFATRNVYIEAENLEALKIISRAYAGRVKMIYIDPPYNTGNDFVYNDKFAVGSREYMAAAGMLDKKGRASRAARAEVRNLNGHKHSAWLSMMWPRLMLAHGTLAQNGVIFISIDDNEVHHLRLVMNEIFGEENFVAQMVRQGVRGGMGSVEGIKSGHDYVLAYAKDDSELRLGGIALEAAPLNLRDEKGEYRKGRELNKWGAGSRREDSPTMWFPVPGPGGEEVYPIRNDGVEGRWRWGKKKMLDAVAAGEVIFEKRTDGTYIVYEKVRTEEPGEKAHSALLLESGHTNAAGTAALKDIFDGKALLDYPKPPELIKTLVKIAGVKDGDIVMDFFSGSATTAHAVMSLNAEDGGKRRCVSVQFPEPTPAKSPARAAGFRNIAEIGRERLIRAGKQIRESANGNIFAHEVDVGFRYFRWSEDPTRKWPRLPPDTDKEEWMRMMETRRKLTAKADPLLLLTGAMLNSCYPLCANIEEKTVKVPDPVEGDKGRTVSCKVFHVTTPRFSQGFYFCPEQSVPVRIGRELNMRQEDLLVCHDDALDDSAAVTISRRHRLRVV